MNVHPGLRLVLGYLLCLPLAVVFYQVGSAGHDDSHITFWQAWTLNHHGALLNYNGERVEQSSSLLQVLLSAALARLSGLDEASSGYLLSLAAAIVTILLVYRIALRSAMESPWMPALLTSSSIYFSYWACSGMETALAALCVVLFIDRCMLLLEEKTTAHWISAMICGCLIATVRPEMILVGSAWLCCMAWCYPRDRRYLFTLLAPFLLVVLWRYSYFGQWFPNPVYAKTRGINAGALLEQWGSGFDYFLRLGREPSSLALSALFTGAILWCARNIWLSRRRPPIESHTTNTMQPWLLWLALYAGFIIGSGGDWMKEGRFWVPLIAPAALVTSTTIQLCHRPGRFALISVFLLLQLIYTKNFLDRFNYGMTMQQQTQWKKVFPYASFFERSNREHLRDLPAIAELERWIPLLSKQEQRPITLMSKQMGLVNYTLGTQFFGKFSVMDMAGLVENSLRRCPVLAQDGFEKQGMRLNYRKFFERLPTASSRCQIKAPDIIYDIYGWGETTPLPDYLQTQGYRIVFQQIGRVNMLPGSDVTAQEMIAIKQDLLQNSVIKTEWLDFDRLLPH